jgi:hypothetical protein
MDTYELIPAWLGMWMLGISAADVYFRRKRNPSYRSLLLQFRIWEAALVMLLFFSFTKFEKTSLEQTLLLIIGPMLSLLPAGRFFVKRRAMLRETLEG